jgi:ABC-2 type transport system permease protein
VSATEATSRSTDTVNVEPPGAGPELRPIPGPSALGGGRRRFFQLLWLLSSYEFKTTYHGTALGYVWSLVRPLLLFGVLLLVFTQIFDLGNTVRNYPPVLLLSVMLFMYFSEVTQSAVTSVATKEQIVRKTQFPRLVIPLSVAITGIFHLLLNLLVVMVFVLAYGVDPAWSWLGLPLILLALVVITSAVGVALSALYVRFRDTAIIWSVVSLVLFYGTPILYVIEMVPESFRFAVLSNPLAPIFEQARHWITDPEAPSAVEAIGSWPRMMVPLALFAVICILSAVIFHRAAPRIAEEL